MSDAPVSTAPRRRNDELQLRGREEAGSRVESLAAEFPATWGNRLSFGLFRRIVSPLLRVGLRIRVVDAPSLREAYVLVANHASFLDPIVLGAASPRRVTFMMTQLHFRSATLGWFYRWSRSIPIAVRGLGNRAALRAGRAVLRRGEVLAVFPEGGLTRDGRLLLGNAGAVSLALAEDVPIVPVHIGGTFEAMPIGGSYRRVPLTVRFGQPVHRDELFGGDGAADRRSRLQVATAAIMARIASLGGTQSRESELRGIRSRTGAPPGAAAATST
ncbi:MAG: 1-acyl-sn-glycerol-3-phosphate acyltransferase [Planctomycetes bacterium]|nr:1-acyl-sn-glycerol-3-phosphate acyltransferase [Planctomycetota bacterium]